MSLAERLASLRRKKGMTQMELAEKLKVSRQAISGWEVGSSTPNMDNLKALSELYGVSIDDLLTNDTGTYFESNENRGQKQNVKTALNQHSVIWVSILAILLAVGIAIYSAAVKKDEQKSVIPIGEMESEVDDGSPAITFSIE